VHVYVCVCVWGGFSLLIKRNRKESIYSIFPEAEVPHMGDSEINPLLDDDSHRADPALVWP